MTLIVHYPTKKALKECIGKRLQYTETAVIGFEYRSDGSFVVCNRPHITGYKPHQEFFAKVTMEKGLIKKVE
jgi:hypothetical protein